MAPLVRLTLGVTLVSLLVPVPAQAQEILESQIAAVADSFAAEGFRRLPADRTGAARAGETATLAFDLRAGADYVIVGVCDQDCDDLDLVLQGPGGDVIGQDFEVDAYPMVSAESAAGGAYRVRVDMVTCSIEPCAFLVTLFERGGSATASAGPATAPARSATAGMATTGPAAGTAAPSRGATASGGTGGNPGDLSLVGGWRDERDIADNIALDAQGYFKTGNDEWGYTSVGTYTFDGRTITVQMHRAEGLEYTAGETYTFPVRAVSSSGFDVDKGDYSTRYVPTTYAVTEDDRNSVRALFHHAALENTWWESDGEVLLFLAPDFLIVRRGGDFDIRRFFFVGNELRLATIDADGAVSRFGSASGWSSDRIDVVTGGGARTLVAGSGSQALTPQESELYRNYVVLTQNATLQALLGITQGMGIIDVVWR